jgi:hypothetical protein
MTCAGAIFAVLPLLVAVVAVPLASVHGTAPHFLPALARLRARDLRFSSRQEDELLSALANGARVDGRQAAGHPFFAQHPRVVTNPFFTRAQGVLRLHRGHAPECFRRGVRRVRSPKPQTLNSKPRPPNPKPCLRPLGAPLPPPWLLPRQVAARAKQSLLITLNPKTLGPSIFPLFNF